MSLFVRVFQHLLPRSPAWSLTFNKTLAKLFAGIAAPFEDPDPTKNPRAFADAIFADVFPNTTRQASKWLSQFGLEQGADDAADVLQLSAAWQAQGGQSPKYIQDTLQAAGFPLFVHEWWQEGRAPFAQLCAGDALGCAGEPKDQASSRSYARFVKDPRDYTTEPIVGDVQASSLSDQPEASALPDQPQSNAFLINNPGYIANLDLSPSAPPPIPDDSTLNVKVPLSAWDWFPTYWPYFIYLGGETFPDRVSIPASRRAELERLILKIRPQHQWIVMLVDYVADAPVTVGGIDVTVGGVPVVIGAGGSTLVAAAGVGVTVGGVPVSASA